jgi:hypothetical protein
MEEPPESTTEKIDLGSITPKGVPMKTTHKARKKRNRPLADLISQISKISLSADLPREECLKVIDSAILEVRDLIIDVAVSLTNSIHDEIHDKMCDIPDKE